MTFPLVNQTVSIEGYPRYRLLSEDYCRATTPLVPGHFVMYYRQLGCICLLAASLCHLLIPSTLSMNILYIFTCSDFTANLAQAEFVQLFINIYLRGKLYFYAYRISTSWTGDAGKVVLSSYSVIPRTAITSHLSRCS